eukprot:Clim_evm6s23 gene=Clim_evmTU6s23
MHSKRPLFPVPGDGFPECIPVQSSRKRNASTCSDGSGRSAETKGVRVVIKIGSSSIVDETIGSVSLSRLASLIKVVESLKRHGNEVVVVTSGAVGLGTLYMGLEKKPEDIRVKQALAACGQNRLMRLYTVLLDEAGLVSAQVLLTRGEVAEKEHYANAKQTLQGVLRLGGVPIINEDDTNSIDELRVGDNDTLSAIVAGMIEADYLFLLTDVNALYTANPAKDSNAKPIWDVYDIDEIAKIISVEGTGSGSKWGTGGMETKISAARLAVSAGCSTVICHANHLENVQGVLEGKPECGTIFHARRAKKQ